MFWNNFPYSDVHNINLDWIIKTVKMLFNSAVFSINGHTPDSEGNVQLTGTELGAVGTVNGKSPDSNGNVEVGTVRTINNQIPNQYGEIDVGKVRTVNGFAPDAQGEVKAGTIRSVNGKSPMSLPTPGAITLVASDVGAIPDTVDPVESVNGLTPDANGNVNVGTVKSVNNTSPDANGNVNLPTVAGVTSVDGVGPDGSGNVQINAVKTINSISPDANGNVGIKTYQNISGVTLPHGNYFSDDGEVYWRAGVAQIKLVGSISGSPADGDIVTTIPASIPKPSGFVVLQGFDATGKVYGFRVRSDDNTIRFTSSIPANGAYVFLCGFYMTYGALELPIVSS